MAKSWILNLYQCINFCSNQPIILLTFFSYRPYALLGQCRRPPSSISPDRCSLLFLCARCSGHRRPWLTLLAWPHRQPSSSFHPCYSSTIAGGQEWSLVALFLSIRWSRPAGSRCASWPIGLWASPYGRGQPCNAPPGHPSHFLHDTKTVPRCHPLVLIHPRSKDQDAWFRALWTSSYHTAVC